jgi:hypothetical protein
MKAETEVHLLALFKRGRVKLLVVMKQKHAQIKPKTTS